MSEIGKSIKSFNPDTVTGKILEVTNYPLRKRNQEEIAKAAKVRRLRGIQLLVSHALENKTKSESEVFCYFLKLDLVCCRIGCD